MRSGQFPQFVQFETSTRCNAGCIMCPNKAIQGTRPDIMNPSVLSRILAEIKENKDCITRILPFNYGEPLMYPELFPLIMQLVSIVGPWRVLIYSNGSLLIPGSEEFTRLGELVQRKYCSVVFSVDGYEHYQEIRTNLNRDQIYENIIQFANSIPAEAREMLMVEMCVSPINAGDIFTFAEIWDRNNIRWNLAVMDGRFDKTLSNARQNLLPCRSLWETVYILTDGTITPCCVDWAGQCKFGNILTDSIREVWNGPLYREMRNNHLRCKRELTHICATCDRNF